MSTPEPQPYLNFNNKPKATYITWTAGDWWMAIISLLGIVAATYAAHLGRLHWGFVVLISLVALLLNIHVEYARLYKEIGQLIISGCIVVFLKGVLWEEEVSSSSPLRRFIQERRYRRYDRRAVIPYSIHSVEAEVDEKFERYGVLHELDSDFGYMYVFAEGSAYSQLDLEDQQRALDGLSKALNTFFGTAPDDNVGVTQLRVHRPADLTDLSRLIAFAGDPFVAYRDGLPASIDPQERHFELDEGRARWAEFRARNNDHLPGALRRNAATRSWQLLVISFKWKAVAKRAVSGKLDSRQIVNLPLIDLGKTLNEELKSVPLLDLQNPHVLDPIELAHFIRASLNADVAATEKFYNDVLHGRFPASADELELVTSELVEEQPDKYKKSDIGQISTDFRFWPRKQIVVEKDRILIDDTWFMPIRLTQTPEVEHTSKAQQIHWATPFGEWSSFAIVSSRTSGNIDTNVLMKKEVALRSLEAYRTKDKMIVNPNIRRRQQLADGNLMQMSASSTNQRYLSLMVLTAPADNSELLDKRLKVLRVRLKSQGILVAPIKGQVRMLDAVLSGTLGVSRL